MIYSNILQLIGNTPLIKIKDTSLLKVKIFAKLEGNNPSGSIKDRIALFMLKDALKKVKKNQIFIEASSGNTGISLAMIAGVLNLKLEIVMSEGVSIERRKLIKAYGAKVILSDAQKGTFGAIEKVKSLLKKYPHKYYYLNQHNNKNNVLAHYQTTGPEIFKQMQGKIDYVVCALGTSGTIMGIARYLKKKNKKIKIFAVEPVLGQTIQGMRNLEEKNSPKDYSLLDKTLIDETIYVKEKDAYETAREIIQKQGIFVGQSSGAVLFAGRLIAKKYSKGNLVVIFPDRGEKYLSTKLFE